MAISRTSPYLIFSFASVWVRGISAASSTTLLDVFVKVPDSQSQPCCPHECRTPITDEENSITDLDNELHAQGGEGADVCDGRGEGDGREGAGGDFGGSWGIVVGVEETGKAETSEGSGMRGMGAAEVVVL